MKGEALVADIVDAMHGLRASSPDMDDWDERDVPSQCDFEEAMFGRDTRSDLDSEQLATSTAGEAVSYTHLRAHETEADL
eukprot:601081-Amphidinium_carterae.1